MTTRPDRYHRNLSEVFYQKSGKHHHRDHGAHRGEAKSTGMQNEGYGMAAEAVAREGQS